MPQYVRENGGIRVVPDDNTTEDGEIDLSPTRKIIDEGNIVLEGRDDGSTVIREKRPTDHTFLSNKQDYEYSAPGSFGFGLNSIYHKKSDTFLLPAAIDSQIDVIDASDLPNVKQSISSNHEASFLTQHQPTSKIFAGGKDGANIDVIEFNSSTGNFEVTNTISTPGTGSINGLYCFEALNILVSLNESEITYIDPISESIIESDTNFSINGERFTTSLESSKLDRGLFLSYDFTNDSHSSKLINFASRSSSDLSDFFEDYMASTYIPQLDIYFTMRGDENGIYRFEKIDGSTLEVKESKSVNETNPGREFHLVLEDRFLIRGELFEDSSKTLQLVDPKTLTVLEEFETDFFFQGASLDTKRSKIFVADDGISTFDYNPFYN